MSVMAPWSTRSAAGPTRPATAGRRIEVSGGTPEPGALDRPPIDQHLLAGVSALIRSAAEGRGGTVVIRGAFGSGRTAMLESSASLARAEGFRTATGFCHYAESGTRLGLATQITESLFDETPGDEPDEAAAFRRLRRLTDDRPLLLCVDDLQWADAPSLHRLCYTVRRIMDLPVLVAVTIRDGWPLPDLAVSDLEDSRLCRAVVRLGPLDAPSVADTVHRWYPEADSEFCAACERLTGGNPWLLTNLLNGIGARGCRLRAPEAEQVIRGCYAVAARLNCDLTRLCRDGVRFAQAVAALDDEATPDAISAATGISAERCGDMLRTLTAAGYLREVSPARFAHPMVRSILLSELSSVSRAGLHRGLRENLPSETASELFTQLGHGYLGTDLPAAAAAYESAANSTRDPGRRTAAVLSQAATMLYLNRIDEAAALLETEVTEAGSGGAPRAQALRGLVLALRCDTMCEVPGAIERLRRDCAADGYPEDPLVQGMLALGRTTGGAVPSCAPRSEPDGHVGLIVWAMALLRADELGLAADWCGQEAEDAVVLGDTLREGAARLMRAPARLALGQLACARRDAGLAAERFARAGVTPESTPARLALVYQVDALVKMGAATTAAELIDSGGAAGTLSDGFADSLLLGARGTVRILLGDADDGLRDLRACQERLRAHPVAFGSEVARLSDAALVEHRLGHARHAYDLAVTALAAAEATGSQRCVGMALHALGVTAPDGGGITLLTRAAETLGRTSARLATAAVKVELGGALRRGNRLRQSRHLLHEGHTMAVACGAQVLAARAAEELAAARGRIRRTPAGPELLTGSEERIAALVCDGKSNSEVAAHLFIARRTVETHLTRIYRKLGISGRTELADVLRAYRQP